jgi:stachydrine N-demethylase, reductase component
MVNDLSRLPAHSIWSEDELLECVSVIPEVPNTATFSFQAVREAMQGLGFDMNRYHQESFQAKVESESDAPELDDVVPDEETHAEVTFATSGVTARVAQTETILAAARANGLNIPSGCTFGVCGTCKVKKTTGEVHMVHNGGISEDDIADGYILACCSNPIGSVTVDV